MREILPQPVSANAPTLARVSPQTAAKTRARIKAWQVSHPEKMKQAQKTYKATLQKKCAEDPEFAAATKARIAAQPSNTPEKRQAKVRKYQAADPARAKAQQAQTRQRHPEISRAAEKRRRARKAGAPLNDFTADQWQEMKVAYGYRCAYQASPGCRRRIMKHLTQDHLTPLANGGSHTAANIVPACRSCNSKKGKGAVLIPVQPVLLLLAPKKGI